MAYGSQTMVHSAVEIKNDKYVYTTFLFQANRRNVCLRCVGRSMPKLMHLFIR